MPALTKKMKAPILWNDASLPFLPTQAKNVRITNIDNFFGMVFSST
jgi:hypothetical protein